jgi:hypothetical protein
MLRAEMSSEPPVTLVYRDEGASLGYFRNVALFIWYTRISLPHIEAAHNVMDALLAQSDSIVALTLIPDMRVSNLGMDDEVRRRHTQLYQKVASRAVGNAIAVETPGFVAAFVRSVISTTLHLTRSPVPTRIFEARAHAAEWLVKQLPQANPPLRAGAILSQLSVLASSSGAR